MKASIHFTDFDPRYFPDISLTEDTETGIMDDPEKSRALNMRTVVIMFITIIKSGKGGPLLQLVREMYAPLYAEMEAKVADREKLQ